MSLARLLLWSLVASSLFAARFDLDTPGRIVRLSDPQLSPDGSRIAVVVSRANFEDNRFDTQLVLIDVATRTQQALTHDRRGVAQPRWSPDGAHLAFLASVEAKPQVFLLSIKGGEARQLTRAPQGVQQYAFSPAADRIAYVTQDEAAKREGPQRHNRSFEIAHNDFLTTTQPLPAHLWVIPTAGGTARRITSGSWTLPISFPPSPPAAPLSWTPDGRSVSIVKVATPYSGDFNQAAVQILDVETGQMRPLTGRTTNEAQPLISPDGRNVSYWYPRDSDTKNVNEIFVAPFGGGEGRSLTRAIDRNVQRAIWMPDSKSLLVSANDGTSVGLWIQPLDGPAQRIDTGRIVATAAFWLDASVSPKGQIAFTGSEPNRPIELYYLETPRSAPVRLTDLNKDIAALELGRSETVRWDGPDGYKNDGVVTYPPDFQAGRKYPLVLYIHGGPRSASKEAFSNYAQLFAAQGWIVFEPNYRGSDNLGNAFQAAIWNDAGAGPGRDVMSGLDVLRKRGVVDEKNIATTGWSYGGYMTTWLLGNYPDVWRAGVAGAAVTDMLDQYNLGDANVRRGAAFGGSPYTDPKRMDAFRAQSPMTYATRVKAPTLIMATTGDYRVPITQSYRFYHALRDRGVTTQFIGYPLPGHSPADPVHQRDVFSRYVGWLKQHLAAAH
ncbi:MAG: S9 family peptidase [Bryobacteraceae bacterium]|nr:S9 family peptidase [Bryobacteraceae bacterium]